MQDQKKTVNMTASWTDILVLCEDAFHELECIYFIWCATQYIILLNDITIHMWATKRVSDLTCCFLKELEQESQNVADEFDSPSPFIRAPSLPSKPLVSHLLLKVFILFVGLSQSIYHWSVSSLFFFAKWHPSLTWTMSWFCKPSIRGRHNFLQ